MVIENPETDGSGPEGPGSIPDAKALPADAHPAHDSQVMASPIRSAFALVASTLGLAIFAHVATAQPAAPPAARPAGQPAPAAPADVAAPPAEAVTAASGLASRVLQAGAGEERPGPTDLATFHYTGWTADGKAFQSTPARGVPATTLIDRLLPGLGEGLQLMAPGEKRRLWVPEALAFKGEKGRPEGPLVFDVELIRFEADPRKAPVDLLSPPEDGKLPSGLASRVLRAGTGTARPKSWNRVRVHYTGWSTDGVMFDSSVVRGEPAVFPLDQVIRGWTEGVQLMVAGEKRRFWIPARLAYGNEPGKPRGMLVFDIELIGIEK